MIIRNSQIKEFQLTSQRDFEKRLLAHVYECFPEEYENFNEQELKEIIHLGINKAESYGFDTEINICRFVDLLFILDTDFDLDEEFSWAQGILNDDKFINQDEKMESLYGELENKIPE